MMETTDSGKRDDLPGLDGLHRAASRRALAQSHVRPISVVVEERLSDQQACVSFIPDDDVIEALSP